MRYLLLATDYDGTLASHGVVSDQTVSLLQRVRASGRKIVLVTGRHLPDLKNIFPQLDLFPRVVAENGALLYRPSSHEEKLLCEPPPREFLDLLRERNVPFTAGRGIVATWEPQQEAVLKAIHDLGLELQLIFNKGAVMVLPSGVNKGTGLKAALEELSISFHNVVGIGDAENDHALLSACECGVAVDNALPFLKQRADIVTQGRNGAGVSEIAERLLSDDLAEFDMHLLRHSILLGERTDGSGPLRIPPIRSSILVAGPSASGKSTVVAGLLEQLAEQQYQFCLIDPEGDYENLTGALTFGTAKERPDPRAVLKALEMPDENVIVNLLGMPVGERPEFFCKFLPSIQDLRARTARPHWLIVDEAHHLLPSSWSPASTTIPQALEGTILVTVHPDHVSAAALAPANALIAVGKSPMQSLRSFAGALRISLPGGDEVELKSGDALVWFRQEQGPPLRVRTSAAKEDRRRHLRLYAEGELSPQQSFYFRGPDRKLNLRAQNLMMFMQLAEGVDESTWTYHLRRGDYSRWFREFVKDHELATNTAAIEQDNRLSAEESCRRIKEMIQSRYTAPV
ncbi:MAG: phosphoglycolate phosphatase [Acidobacteria bacterium]|nr:MAG: phosphoglycolate phosphatase [Acidobacteriota bacterium]PYY07783.1 MAG: phosphoglycolate phosphatase [Acidobacteriota bacterium]